MKSIVKYLIVDLDQSLCRIDISKEIFFKFFFASPLIFFKTLILLIKSKSEAKYFISKQKKIDCSQIPFNKNILELISFYKNNGYKIILATGAPKLYADEVKKHFNFFDEVLSSTKTYNNVGSNKLISIKEKIKDSEYIYIGDSKQDLPIWLDAKKAIVVGNRKILKSLKSKNVEIVKFLKTKVSLFKLFFQQIRAHQWSKNFLLFAPVLASHSLYSQKVFFNTLIAFISFSLIASCIYIFNDIIDVDNDRFHNVKKNRPIASGYFPIQYSFLIIGFFFPIGFFWDLY